ncbi:MAG: GNAT family N-acetyltransferase [Candidatus Limnocylindrales bacterium]
MIVETGLGDLPVAADYPGITFRGFRGIDADLPGMAEANRAARLADGEIEPLDFGAMRNLYSHFERCDPATDILIAEADGEIVAYARVEWNDTNDGERIYAVIALVHPRVRDRGVPRALHTWSERRRRAIAAAHTAAGEALDRPRWLMTFIPDTDRASGALVRAAGYEPFRRFHQMVRPDLEVIPDVPLPDGLEVRPIVAESAILRRIFLAQAEAFRDGFGWVDETDEAFAQFREDPTKDPALWVVAFEGEEVAGAVMPVLLTGRDGAVEGWLDPVFTRRPWRRRGLARALIARSLVTVRDRGAARSCLGVDAQNPNQALDLYESCGFLVASSETGYRRSLGDRALGRGGVA